MQMTIPPDELTPIVRQIVEAVLDELKEPRIALNEDDAAAAIGVEKHVLRDARLRREIVASRVGRTHVYKRSDLEKFLKERQRNGD